MTQGCSRDVTQPPGRGPERRAESGRGYSATPTSSIDTFTQTLNLCQLTKRRKTSLKPASQICVFRDSDDDCDACYRLVTEVTYDQECDNIVQHVCEELYHVPVPVRHVSVPVKHVSVPVRHVPDLVTPRPIFTPAPGSRIPRSSHQLRETTGM